MVGTGLKEHPSPQALDMEENGQSPKEEEGEEHEEGEISDEEPPLPSSGSEEQVESARVDEDEAVELAAEATAPSSPDGDPTLQQKEAPLQQEEADPDGLAEMGTSELRASAAAGQTKDRADVYRGRRRELDSSDEDDGGNSHKRNDWGAYGSNLYNFAWAQAVAGRPSFASAADQPSIEPTSSKLSGDGSLSSGSGGLGAWSTENHRKLSREFSRDSELYRRSSRSSEEQEDMSPLRENGSRGGERGSSERADTTGRGRRTRETSWSDWETSRAERPRMARIRGERSERGGLTDDEEYTRGLFDGEEGRRRRQRSESQSPKRRVEEVGSGGRSLPEQSEQNGEGNAEVEGREEGELEEGEIELGTLPAPQSASPSKESPDISRQGKYSGIKALDYWTKDRAYARSLGLKSQSRSQIDDCSSRRHRQLKPQETQREKRLALAADLVKNVTVKDAQKSFVDVCSRLHKTLRVLDELHVPRQAVPPEGRLESPPHEITALARQAFAGIRAVYAVRNTASGREQERDKNIFPRLLELANGYCQKLFTPKQTRELDVMMQTIAKAGRLNRDGTEKGQYPREQQLQPASKTINDNDAKPGNHLGNNIGSAKVSVGEEPKSRPENNIAGRILGFVDAKQAEEAAAIAAAALAYAQSSAAARASSLFGGNYDTRSSGITAQATGPWGRSSEDPSQVQHADSGMKSLQPNNNGYNPSMGKYQPWSGMEQRQIKFGQDAYGGHFVDVKARDMQAPGSAPLRSLQKELNLPPGYSKAASTIGMLEDGWEELNPPGAGLSNYVPVPAAPVQLVGIKEEPSRGQMWPSRPELGTPLPYQNGRGSAPQYSAEHLLNANQQRGKDTAGLYSIERLPSPTPDEDEDASVASRLPSLDTKPSLVVEDIEKSNGSLRSEGAGKSAVLLPGLVHNLTRSQSLDGPGPAIEPKMQKEKLGELMLPLATRSLEDMESAKNSSPLPPKGISRSRDPRRRFQTHSLDLTDMGGMDLNSQVMPVPNAHLGEVPAAGNNRKHFLPDVDDKEDAGVQKRQKGQSESSVDSNSFIIDSLHASSGTGGWLDDNVPSFVTIEELPTDMEVDVEGPSTSFEVGKGIGRELKISAESRLDVFPDSLNSIAASKKQKLDQSMGEVCQRKMKARDPRRVFLESHVERSDSPLSDRADGMVTIASIKGEVSSLGRATPDSAGWHNKDSFQASKQGASLPNIAPHFMEKLASIAGMVGSTPMSLTESQLVMKSGEGLSTAVTEGSVTLDSVDVDRTIFSNELISLEISEHQRDKSTNASTGPWKPKGSPSQWGASQVHPGLEQLLGDLSKEERRIVEVERKRRMEEQDRMFSAGKLCLVLDLDHTLLNSAKFSEIEQEWDQRLRAAETSERNRAGRDGLERRELYRFPHMSMWTKLRPGIWKFLARASQLYELHVYTMGNKVYATEMAKLLDPTGKLFAGRVISKGDDGDGDDLLPKSKDLDGVLGMESSVVIIDDSARVWPHHSQNLIVVERYMYFPCSRRQFGLTGPSLLEVGHDERESDGMLASALGVIDRIHQSFFENPRLREVDVREILAAQQRLVLKGCKVVFSRVFPVGEAVPHRHPLWRTAEQFGAVCSIAIDEMVTHVVAISLGTDKVNWALETGRYVVRPAWLEASTILYRRANERDFPVLPQ